MKKKENLKTYRNKERIFCKVTGAPGISRLYQWDDSRREYITPLTAKPYNARRYIFQNGERKREFAFFSTLEEARLWQSNLRPAGIGILMAEMSRKSPTVHQVVVRWKKDEWPSLAENTIIQYEKCLKFLDEIMHREIESILAVDIDSLIATWRLKVGTMSKTRTSFSKEYEMLVTLFRWYQKNYDDAQLVMPFKDRHSDRIKVKKTKKPSKQFMSEEQTDRFLIELKKDSPIHWALAFV